MTIITASRIAQSLVTGSPGDRVDAARARVYERIAKAVLLMNDDGQALGVIPSAVLNAADGASRLGTLKRQPLTAVRPNTDLGLLIGDLKLEPRDAWFALQDENGFTGVISPNRVRVADVLRRRATVVTRGPKFGAPGQVRGGELWGEIEVALPYVAYRCPNGHQIPAEQAALHYDDDGNVRCPHDTTVMIREIRQVRR